LDKFLKPFLENTKIAFGDIAKNGRSITLNIGLGEATNMDLDTEVGEKGDLLSDVIEKWLEENAFKSQFNIQGITATQMIVNEVKIPKIDEATKYNYSPSKFAKAFRKHLKSLDIESVIDLQGKKQFYSLTKTITFSGSSLLHFTISFSISLLSIILSMPSGTFSQ